MCSFIRTPLHSIPKAEGGGSGTRTKLLAQTSLHPRVLVGVCPGIPCFRSPPRPLHASLDAWMTASCRAAHHQRDLKLLSYFQGSPSRVSTFVSLISDSDIRDRRGKRLKVIMLL